MIMTKAEIDSLPEEEKEDLALLLLIQEADRTKTVSREEVFNIFSELKNSN